jgi:hypothetical protein
MLKSRAQTYFDAITTMKSKLLAALLISAMSCAAYAYDEWTVATKITQILSYTQFGSGDVAFTVANPTTNCPTGYWLTKSDPGFSANYAIILGAYWSQNSVKVVGLPDQKWSGSSATFCKVYVISPA